MKTIITFIIAFFMSIVCFSQYTVAWEKSYGGSDFDFVRSFQNTLDGGYIVAGFSQSNDGDVPENHGGYDMLILKFDSVGTLEWQKSFGGSLPDAALSIQQTSDSGYILAGYSESNDGDVTINHGGRDFWVVKITSTGAMEWQKSFGGSANDIALSVEQTTDGGYIVAGSTESDDGDVTENKGNGDFWIIKLNSNGVLEWQKSLGGPSSEGAVSIKQTPDGGYVVAGYSFSQSGDVTGNHGSTDYWVVKLTDSGAMEWENSYGGLGAEWAYSLQLTSDGGYIVAGSSDFKSGDVSENYGYSDFWVVKLTTTGLIDWEKSYGGGLIDYPKSIQKTSDGGYIISGTSGSNDGLVSGNQGQDDYWIVKISATGTFEWQKSLGGSGVDNNAYALQVSSEDYIVAGSTDSNDGDVTGNHGSYDAWVAQITPVLGVDENDLANIISLYPNPNNGWFYLNLSNIQEASSIFIYDILGRLVYSKKDVSPGTVKIDQNFAAGTYMVTISSGVTETTLKMIVE